MHTDIHTYIHACMHRYILYIHTYKSVFGNKKIPERHPCDVHFSFDSAINRVASTWVENRTTDI